MNQPPKTDFKRGKKFFWPLLLLLLFPFGNLEAQGCDCPTCAGPIPILSTNKYELSISGATNNDLSNPGQGVCGVFIDIDFEHIWSLTITLTSPSGQIITLMGPYDNYPGTTGGSNWDISFLPCTEPVAPDVFPITYNDQWTNLQQWAFGVNYTGSYYPYQGCLEDFTGSVNGNWTLSITNGSSIYDTGNLNGFSILFCDPAGTGCDDCDAFAGDLSGITDIDLCEGESFNGSIAPTYGFGEEPNNQYSYTYIISQNSIIENFNTNPDFSSFTSGNYEVCGLSFLTSEGGSIPPPNGVMTVADLENLLNSSPPFCGDISDDCFLVNIFSPPPTIFITDSFCENEGYEYGGNSYSTTGIYNATFPGVACDTMVELNLTMINSSMENIAMTICQGDTFFIGNSFYTTPGNYSDTLQNINNCDSIINLELDVLNPQSNISSPPMITCNTPQITLNGGGSTAGSGVTYFWTTNDGNITGSTVANNTTVNAAGKYYLSVTVNQNSTICTDLDSVQVTADVASLPNVNAGLDSTLTCGVTDIILQGTGSSGVDILYEWTTTSGNIVSDTFNLNPTIDAAGTYVLTITNSTTNCSAQDSILIDENIVVPNISLSPDTVITCQNSIVNLDATGSSTGTNIIFSWTTSGGNILSGNDTLIASVDAAGTYFLTITDNENQCSTIDSLQVGMDTIPPIADAGNNITLDCSTPSTQIDATNSSQGTDFSFQWNVLSGAPLAGGENTLTPTVNGDGTYEIVVTNEINGCTTSSQVIVSQSVMMPLIVFETPVDTITCLNITVEIDAQNSSNGIEFQYEWTEIGSANIVSGQNSPLVEVDEIGWYQLQITNTTTGCTQIDSIEVFSNNTLPNVDAGVNMTIDCNQPEVILDGNGSTGTEFEYLWTPSNGGNILMGNMSLNPTVDAAGNYQLQVTNIQNGCTQIDMTSVSVDTILPIADAGIDTLINCENPAIILNGSNSSVGDYSYLWSTSNGAPPFSPATLQPMIIATGDYELLVTNNQTGCVAFDSVFVGENFANPMALAGQDTFITCANPIIFLDGTGSSFGLNFNYEWTTTGGNILSGENSLQPEINGAGTYEIEVTDLINGCTMTDVVIVTSDNDLPIADAGDSDSITCSQSILILDGTLSSSGPNISYLWTTGDGNILIGENTLQPQIDSAGLYILSVNNSLTGCSAQSSVLIGMDTIAPIANAGSDTTLTCDNNTILLHGNNSSIGTNFNYQWTTSGTSTILNPTLLTPEINEQGEFQIEVINTQNGCSAIDETQVTWDTIPPIADAGLDQILNCQMTNVTLGGNASIGSIYSYQWTFSAGGNIISDADSLNISVDEPAVYYLEITNNLTGCTATDEVVVTENITLPIAVAILTDTIPCDGSPITLDGTGSSFGTEFSYLWTAVGGSILSGDNTLFPDVDSAGLYTLTVINNDNHCESTAIVNVVLENCAPIANAGADGWIDCNQTMINLDGSGSSFGIEFTYLWTTSEGNILSGENTLSPLVDSAGIYVLTVENTTVGITTTDTVEIVGQIELPIVNLSVNELLGCVNTNVFVSGMGSSTGSEFSYLWTTVGGNIISPIGEDSIEVNSAGMYFLEITNSNNGCVAIDSIEVFQDNSLPIVDAGMDMEVNCFNAQVSLDGSASSTGMNYTYLWTTGNGNIISGEQTLNPIVDSNGIYILQIIDNSNGCINQDSVLVLENFDNPIVAIAQPGIITCTDSILTLNAGNSSLGNNFLYTWTTGDGNISSGVNTLSPEINLSGNYQLTIFNISNGCSDSLSVFVDENLETPIADAGADDLIACGVPSIFLDGTNSTSIGNLIYTWTTDDGNIVNSNNTLTPEVSTAGTYLLTIENNDNGCVDSNEVVVTTFSCNPVSVIVFPDSLTCTQTEVTLNGSASSSWASLIYQWTTIGGNIIGITDSTFVTVNQPGEYILTITDTLTNKISLDTTTVGVSDDLPVAEAGDSDTLNCSTAQINLNGSTSNSGGFNIYEWTSVDGNIISGEQTLSPLIDSTGTYFLEITNTQNGCTSQDSVTIYEDIENPIVNIEPAGIITCMDSILILDGGNSSLGNNFEYSWTTSNGFVLSGENTLMPVVNSGGNYQLMVLNNTNECVDSLTIFVDENMATPIANAGFSQNLDCGVPSVIIDGTNSTLIGNVTSIWANSDGNVLNDNNELTVEVFSSGTYLLTIENDENGCLDSSEVIVTASTCIPVTVVAFPDTLTCSQTEIALDGSSSSNWASIIYEWTTDIGNILGTTDSTFVIVNQSGDYTLTLTDTLTGSTAFSIVTVIVNSDLPIADAGEKDTLNCVESELNLNGSNSTSAVGINYEWTTIGGNILAGIESVSPLVNEAGMYHLLVTNTLNGCTSMDSVFVEIDTILPLAEAGDLMTLTCADSILILDGSGSSLGSDFIYSWNTSGGNILMGNEGLFPQINGTGTYTLTVENIQNFCIANDQVLIDEDVVLPIINIEAYDDLNCELTSLELDATNSSTGSNFSYNWETVGGNIVSGEETLTPVVNDEGLYSLVILNTENGCLNDLLIEIYQDTISPVSNSGNIMELTCADTILTLDGSNSSIGAEFLYQWISSTGNIVDGGNTLLPVINSSGNYQLIITNNNNMCTSESEVAVTQDIETPIINIDTPETLNCFVENILLNASGSSNGLIYSNLWTTDDGVINFGENTLVPQISEGGTYELMILNTENGCVDSASIIILQDTILPIADAGFAMMLTCADSVFNLDGGSSSLGNEFIYEWNTSNGNIISGENSLQPMIDEIGIYQLQVFNNVNQCMSSDSVEITENIAAPIIEINAIGGLVLNCDVNSIVLDGNSSSPVGNVSFEWTSSNGNILSGANDSNPEVDLLGEYVLTLTNDLNGCTSTEMIEIFEDIEVPVITVLTPGILTCADTLLTLDGTGSSEGVEFEYLWTTSNGNIVSENNNLTCEINSPGNFIFTISNTENGCSINESIEVFQNINSPIADAGGDYEFDCIQTEMTLQGTASQGNEFSYLWSTMNGNIISGATSLQPVVDALGNYTLTVMNSINGCVMISEAIVTEDLDQPVGLEFIASQPLCFGDFNGSIEITNVIGGESPYLYSFENQTFSQYLFFENLPAGNYSIVVQDASGCELSTIISLQDPPEVMVELGADTTIELGTSVMLQAINNIPSSELDSVVWTSSSHGIDCADCLEQEFFPLVSTNYSAWLMNENGCVTEDDLIVYVSNERNIFIPNVFSPNGDGVNDLFMVYGGVGVEEVETFQVFSRWGELVFSKNNFQPNDNSLGWDGYFRNEKLNPGVFVFFAKIKYVNGEIEIIKGDVLLK